MLSVIKYRDRTEFRLAGRLHRSNGPAVIRADGGKEYWQHGRLYKRRSANGVIEWFSENALFHVTYPNGEELYWKFGKLRKIVRANGDIERMNGTTLVAEPWSGISHLIGSIESLVD